MRNDNNDHCGSSCTESFQHWRMMIKKIPGSFTHFKARYAMEQVFPIPGLANKKENRLMKCIYLRYFSFGSFEILEHRVMWQY